MGLWSGRGKEEEDGLTKKKLLKDLISPKYPLVCAEIGLVFLKDVGYFSRLECEKWKKEERRFVNEKDVPAQSDQEKENTRVPRADGDSGG